jgi:hypothetical protein
MSSTTDTSSINLSSTTDTSPPGNSPTPLLNLLNPNNNPIVVTPTQSRQEQNNQLPAANPVMQLSPELLKMLTAQVVANAVSKEQKPSGFLTLFQGTFIMKKWVFWLICLLIMIIIGLVKAYIDLSMAKFANISDYERANNERMDNRPSVLNS